MEEVVMDICKGCGKDFIAGEEGSGRLAVKSFDDVDESYFYEHFDLCAECIKKVVENER